MSWHTIGSAPGSPITALAAGEGLVAVGSLAGIAISENGGRRWAWPGPGLVGPFVIDVGVGRANGVGLIVVAAHAGLWWSRDRGRTWVASAVDARRALPFGPGNVVLLGPDGDLTIGHYLGDTMEQIGSTIRAEAVAVDPAETSIWAATQEGLLASLDGGRTWTKVPTIGTGVIEDLAASSGRLLTIDNEGQLTVRSPSGEWTRVREAHDSSAFACSINPNGETMAAALPEAILVSRDSGRSWIERPVPGSVTCLTSTVGGDVIVGLADGRCITVDGHGGLVTTLADIPTAVMVGLEAAASGVIAATGFGASYRSDDGARTWTVWSRGQELSAAPAISADGLGGIYSTSSTDLVDIDGSVVAEAMPIASPSFLAVTSTADGLAAAVSDGADVASTRPSVPWSRCSVPWGSEQRICAVTIGSLGAVPEPTLVVATSDVGGVGRVWAENHGQWVEVVSGPTEGANALLVSVPGTRGVFAALGRVIYRPAAVGEFLMAPEVLGESGGPVLDLSAVRTGDQTALVALTAAGIYASLNRGLSWESLERLDGPPVTAVAIRLATGLQVVAIRLGGEILALDLQGVAR